MEKQNRINGKDLINIGIFSAIIAIITTAFSMLGFIPVLYPCIAIFVPLFASIPFMLFLTKIKKFGMIYISTIIMGLLMIVIGMGFWPLVVGLVSGLIAEFVFKSENYTDSKKAVLTNAFFQLWMNGNFVEVCFFKEKYFSTRQDFGQEYIDKLTHLMPWWMFFVLLVVTFVVAILSGLLSKKMLKKHFAKAGMI